jgi:hypothetical protein
MSVQSDGFFNRSQADTEARRDLVWLIASAPQQSKSRSGKRFIQSDANDTRRDYLFLFAHFKSFVVDKQMLRTSSIHRRRWIRLFAAITSGR